VSPSIALPTGEAPLTLQYWNRRGMEANGATGCYDGGILEASTNGGSTWTQVGSASLLTDPYTGPISTSFSNPLGGLQAWCGTTEWVQSIVDVSAMAGQNVQFRFRLGSDTSVGADGWYLDDVKVQSCAGGEPVQYTITPVARAIGSIAP
jgi:bacillopeptidase F (M6 metalloprotease family)